MAWSRFKEFLGQKMVLLASFALAGPLAFLQTLLFRPKMLTPYLSGAEGVMPVELQTIATVVVFALSCIACRALGRRLNRAAVVLAGVVAPLACAFVVALVRDVSVAPVVSAVLAMSCGVILYDVLDSDPFSFTGELSWYASSAVISIGVSAVLSHVCYAAFPTDADATVALCAVVATAGAVGLFLRTPPSDAEGEKPAEPVRAEANMNVAKVVFDVVLPIVPAVCICSFSLGSALNEEFIETTMRMWVPFLLGLLATLVVLVGLVIRWSRSADERGTEIALFASVPCALGIVAVFSSGVVLPEDAFPLLICSNLLFIALVWIDVIYLTGRSVFSSPTAPIVSLAMLLLVFCIGVYAGSSLPRIVLLSIVLVAMVAYMVYLTFYAQRSNPTRAIEEAVRSSHSEPKLSFDEMREEACARMAADFGLSSKESEILPLLVTGISASAIGRKMYISYETVKTHKYRIYRKLGVHNFEEVLELFEEYVRSAARQ